MNFNLEKILLYSGVIEVIAGLIVLLFVSRLVGAAVLLVGLVDLGICFLWPSLLRGGGSGEGEGETGDTGGRESPGKEG